jgi:hypothetical protein
VYSPSKIDGGQVVFYEDRVSKPVQEHLQKLQLHPSGLL